MKEQPLTEAACGNVSLPAAKREWAPEQVQPADMTNNVVSLDVREDLRVGQQPFSKIMTAAATLTVGGQLRLLTPFEPVPLYHALASQGFVNTARRLASGDWEILFTRGSSEIPSVIQPGSGQPVERNGQVAHSAEIIAVDARGLEPPQPLVRILEALAALPEGAQLHAHTDRRPMHLYPQLEERGFTAETREQSNGSYLTQIRRR